MKKLVVAYRDNDLFQRYVDDILAQVPDGVEIERIIFPAGTSGEKVKQELIAKLKSIEGQFLFLRDDTCVIYKEDDEALGERLEGREIRQRNLNGGFYDLLYRRHEAIFEGRDFATIFKDFAVKINANPSMVCIVSDSITDHLGWFKRNKMLDDVYDGIRGFAGFLSALLEEFYLDIKICVEQTLKPALEQYGGIEDALLVIDRHCGLYALGGAWDIGEWQYKIQLFVLPFENAIYHLVQQGKLEEVFDAPALYNSTFGKADFS